MTEPSKWWESRQNLIELTAWLAHQGCDAENVAYAVEKPWKYEDEWAEYIATEKAKRANN